MWYDVDSSPEPQWSKRGADDVDDELEMEEDEDEDDLDDDELDDEDDDFDDELIDLDDEYDDTEEEVRHKPHPPHRKPDD